MKRKDVWKIAADAKAAAPKSADVLKAHFNARIMDAARSGKDSAEAVVHHHCCSPEAIETALADVRGRGFHAETQVNGPKDGLWTAVKFTW